LTIFIKIIVGLDFLVFEIWRKKRLKKIRKKFWNYIAE